MNLQVINHWKTILNQDVSYFSLETFRIKYWIAGAEFLSGSEYIYKKRVRIIELEPTDIVLRNWIKRLRRT